MVKSLTCTMEKEEKYKINALSALIKLILMIE